MQGQEGTVVIMVALLIAVLVGIAALAVDVGYIMTAKNELQNIADSAALAAAGQLGKDYEDVPFFEQKTYVCDSEKIISIGRDVASKNRSTGEGGDITVTDSDVEIGTWAPAAWGDPPSFKTPVICNPNAVRVTAHRDGSNPIATFFARIFRIDTVPISDIRATAVLFPVVPDGKVFLPLGISEKYFFDHLDFYDRNINFMLYQSDNYEWHTNDNTSGTVDDFIHILDQLIIDPSTEGPSVEAGKTTLEFLGPYDIPSLSMARRNVIFDKIETIINMMRTKNDNVYDFDEDPNTWTTNIVVYEKHEDQAIDELGGERTIVGFTTVTLRGNFQGSGSERYLNATVKYTMSSTPRLVQ